MKKFIVAMLLFATGASAQTSDSRIAGAQRFLENTVNSEFCGETYCQWSSDATPGVGYGRVAASQRCPNGSIDSRATPPEVCEPGLLGGEDCSSQGFASGTLACSADCLSFDTSACTAAPSAGNVWAGLAAHVPPPGEWALVPNTTPSSVFHRPGEFPFSVDIWGNSGPDGAWIAWDGLALDRVGGRWINAAGGGHNAYGGNEVYLFSFESMTWSRETDPSVRVDDPAFSCDIPLSGPVSRHTYDGTLYVPSTDEIIVAGSAGYCRPRTGDLAAEGSTNQVRVWVYSVAQKTWRELSSLAGVIGINASTYDAERYRVFLARGRDPRQNRFRELDPQNDYAVVREVGITKQYDGAMELDSKTRLLWSVGTSGPGKSANTTIVKIPIALDGTLGAATAWSLSDHFPASPGNSRSLAIHSSGDLVIWHEDDIVTRVAATLDSAETYSGGGPVAPVSSTNIYSKWFYLETLDVFVGMHDPSEGVWLYRLPDDGTVADEPDDVEDAASYFEKLCRQPGVVLCDPLDTQGPFDGHGKVMPNADGSQGLPRHGRTGRWRGIDGSVRKPELDKAVKVSGSGSMRFTIASESDGNDAGEFTTNFSDDLSVVFGPGDTFYTHYKWRASCDLLYLDCDPASPTYKTERREYRTTRDGARLKLSIVGTGDVDLAFPATSCSSLEVVLNHGPDHHLTGYHHCGVNEHFSIRAPGTSDLNFQPGGPYECYARVNGERRDWGNTGPNCFYLEPDEWITFETKIEIGEWQPRGQRERDKLSRITVWAAREGEPLRVVMENEFYLHGPHASDFAKGKDFTARAGFGKIWPHPFINAKDPAEVHPEAYIWYDELIVSTRPVESN